MRLDPEKIKWPLVLILLLGLASQGYSFYRHYDRLEACHFRGETLASQEAELTAIEANLSATKK